MTVAGWSRPGEATERKSQRQGPGCIKRCFEIIVTSSLNVKLFFATRQRFPARWSWGAGVGKRRGLGPKNDVLTICKADTLRFGQRIIQVSFPL